MVFDLKYYYYRYFVINPVLFKLRGDIRDDEAVALYREALSLPREAAVVEIGSFCGKSSCFLAEGLDPLSRLYCIDTWERGTAEIFVRNTQPYRDIVIPLSGRSADIQWDNNIDLLFIDGDHEYAGIKTDINKYLPFTKRVIFHDYGVFEGVTMAVDELGLKPDLRVKSLWGCNLHKKG